jgi:undecaprenyl-diphosphatase
VATLVAFVVGYVVIIGFLKIVSTYSYRPFVVYRLVLAAVVVVLLATGVLTAVASTPAAG